MKYSKNRVCRCNVYFISIKSSIALYDQRPFNTTVYIVIKRTFNVILEVHTDFRSHNAVSFKRVYHHILGT